MKFIVDSKVFELLETACFGVVVARNVDNSVPSDLCTRLLNESVSFVEKKFEVTKVKESADIRPYRDAFTTLGINPNKFMSSIEAMASRIEKKKGFPSINPIVDLGNAISLKYLLPMGAHDMDQAAGDIQVRFSRQGDSFTPFGETVEEVLEDNELIYSVGNKVKTRRWIWRQSELGKITENSRTIFFPIDGFVGINCDKVRAARDELSTHLKEIFAADISVGWIDKDQKEMAI